MARKSNRRNQAPRSEKAGSLQRCRLGTEAISVVIAAALAATPIGCSWQGGSGSATKTAAISGNAPPSAGAEAVSEGQGSFANPVSNTGAFTHSIPIDLPPGIRSMTPGVALAYSSHGGLGNAGVGWDLPLPMITLNQADGRRPSTLVGKKE